MQKKRDLIVIIAIAAIAGAMLLLLPGMRGGQTPGDGVLYLRVSLNGVYEEPLPLLEEKDIVIDQGNGMVNTLHVTKNSIAMRDSTCFNRLCVEQSEVTLENAESRPLHNMIVCAPHRLVLELLTAKEAGHE